MESRSLRGYCALFCKEWLHRGSFSASIDLIGIVCVCSTFATSSWSVERASFVRILLRRALDCPIASVRKGSNTVDGMGRANNLVGIALYTVEAIIGIEGRGFRAPALLLVD